MATKHYLQKIRDALAGFIDSGKLSKEEVETVMRAARGSAGGARAGQKEAEGANEAHELADMAVRLFVERDFAEPPDTINVLPIPGNYFHPEYGVISITKERNAHFVDNFDAGLYQEKLPIDIEHDTKLSGAVGWMTGLHQNADGSVDADVDWNDRGQEAIGGDRFKYFSPEWYDVWEEPISGQKVADVLIGGAITTRPFFKDNVLRPMVSREGELELHIGRRTARFVESKRAQEMGWLPLVPKMTTIGALLDSEVYDALTDAIQDLRADDVITSEEFTQLHEMIGGVLAAVKSAVPAELGARQFEQEEDDDHGSPYAMPWSERRAAEWTTAFINDLPDSAFLYIKPGGTKEDGKTKPPAMRYFPVKDANGKVDRAHVQNALSRIPQADLADDVKAEAKKKAQALLDDLNAASEPDLTGHPNSNREANEPSNPKGDDMEVSEQIKTLTEQVGTLSTQVTATETALSAAETRAKEADEKREAAELRVTALEKQARSRHFIEMVAGTDPEADGSGRWYGPADQHVETMESLADALGEESEGFKAYVETQRTLAKQLHASNLFSEIGKGAHQADSQTADDSDIALAVKAYREANPNATEAEATTAVMSAQPKLYSESLRQDARRRARVAMGEGDDDDEG